MLTMLGPAAATFAAVRGSQRFPTRYIYVWGNNEKRATLKGRVCCMLARLAMNSALVEFENGQREVISRNALRRVRKNTREVSKCR